MGSNISSSWLSIYNGRCGGGSVRGANNTWPKKRRWVGQELWLLATYDYLTINDKERVEGRGRLQVGLRA